MSSVKDTFLTQDGELSFTIIEDESGDIFWGYGHREAAEFTDEVNRWLIHTCGLTDPDDLIALSTPVEHLWARLNSPDDERFTLMEPTEDDVFPVTRLVL